MKLKLIHLPLLYSSSTIKIHLCATTDFMNKVPGVYTSNLSIYLFMSVNVAEGTFSGSPKYNVEDLMGE